jgi:hypothetical protein
MDGHRTADARSLAYHRAIASRLSVAVIDRALERVGTWEADRRAHPRWVAAWRDLLSRSVAQISAALVEDSETMRALRQVSPFAGELGPRERWALWRATSPAS